MTFYRPVFEQLKQNFDRAFAAQRPFIPQAQDIVRLFDGFYALLCQYPLTQTESAAALLPTYTQQLQTQLINAICLLRGQEGNCRACTQAAQNLTQEFIAALPQLQELIFTDVRAAYEGDPAAVDEIEPLLCYPGVRAVAYQRMAHFLHAHGARILPRIITEHAHSLTGIDIHPGAQIGPSFFIDHGTGVVIGETCVIGQNVKIYQGVTLGAKSFPLDANGHPVKGIKRHPRLGDHVIIYAETTILGPVCIGEGSVIGANKWITTDIPPHSKIN